MAIRFAEFIFDLDQRLLLRGSEPVHLEPKAFDLLGLLLSRSPSALPRSDIHKAIWPGTCVSESSLPGLVADLRAALGDDGAQPRFIRTVRGYGYAFCGTTLADAAPAAACRWIALRAADEIPLPDGTHLIGRGERCLIRCESTRVSRCHAQVVITADRVVLEDLGSRNGTWLRGERIQGPSEIQAGDTVNVGNEAIRFVAAGPDASTLSDD
jgi:DNA-binding winged helix-turn-helix (wHTH) protein